MKALRIPQHSTIRIGRATLLILDSAPLTLSICPAEDGMHPDRRPSLILTTTSRYGNTSKDGITNLINEISSAVAVNPTTRLLMHGRVFEFRTPLTFHEHGRYPGRADLKKALSGMGFGPTIVDRVYPLSGRRASRHELERRYGKELIAGRSKLWIAAGNGVDGKGTLALFTGTPAAPSDVSLIRAVYSLPKSRDWWFPINQPHLQLAKSDTFLLRYYGSSSTDEPAPPFLCWSTSATTMVWFPGTFAQAWNNERLKGNLSRVKDPENLIEEISILGQALGLLGFESRTANAAFHTDLQLQAGVCPK